MQLAVSTSHFKHSATCWKQDTKTYSNHEVRYGGVLGDHHPKPLERDLGEHEPRVVLGVDAKDGKVVLHGNVHNWAEVDEAQRAAGAAPLPPTGDAG